MKKRNKIILIIVILVCIIIPLSMNYLNKKKIQNVFDEIYYDELGTLTKTIGIGNAALGKIKGMVNWNRSDEYDFDISPVFFERYSKDALPPDLTSLEYSFSFENEELQKNVLVMSMQKKLTSSLFVYISYVYRPENRTLKTNIVLKDENKTIARDKETIQRILNENNRSLTEIEQFGEDILKNKLLKDWFSVYPSKFSLDNLGEVKTENSW